MNLLTPRRRVRVEFRDREGTKHTVTLEGELTREKIIRVLDYVELMGGHSSRLDSAPAALPLHMTLLDKVLDLIKKEFPSTAFTSREVRRAFADAYGHEVRLSTISTYLCRLRDRGLLIRSGSSQHWNYVLRLPAAPL